MWSENANCFAFARKLKSVALYDTLIVVHTAHKESAVIPMPRTLGQWVRQIAANPAWPLCAYRWYRLLTLDRVIKLQRNPDASRFLRLAKFGTMIVVSFIIGFFLPWPLSIICVAFSVIMFFVGAVAYVTIAIPNYNKYYISK